MKIVWLSACAILATFLCACDAMWEDFADKSINASVSGIGGDFTTSINPTTGAVSPEVKMGDLSASLMSHKPGDGTQVYIDSEKSWWGASIGSNVVKINAKNGLKNFSYSYSPTSSTDPCVLSFDDASDVDSSSIHATAKQVTALALKLDLDKKFLHQPKDKLTKMQTDLAQMRFARKDLGIAKQLAAMPEDELLAVKPSGVAENRLVGDEVMWRELDKRLTPEVSK